MGILPLALGGSILTAPISDRVSEKLTQFLNRRSVQSFMDHLKQYELDFEATHDGTIATSGHFLACLQSLCIVDRIVSHVLEPHMDAPTEEQLLAQLGKEMLDYLAEARSQSPSYEDRQTIEVFLSEILKEVKDFLSASRAPEQREPLYVTCQNNAELRDIKKTLGALDTKLSASTPPAEESPSSELPESFDAHIRTCNEALRKARNRVDVYSMNKLDFDAVYILPTLTYVDNAPDFSFPHYKFHHIRNSYQNNLLAFLQSVGRVATPLYEQAKNICPDPGILADTKKSLIGNLFAAEDIVYIIGGAGFGKSLFLRNLEVNPNCLAGFDQQPLLVLSGNIKKLVRPDGNLKPMRLFLEECFANRTLVGPDEPAPDFLSRCLSAGRCLILLDALDEVGNDKRDEIHNLIIEYFKTYAPGNHVCITSRDRGFIPHEHITCLQINPITQVDIAGYVDRFIALDRFDAEEKDRFVEQASALAEKGFVKGFLTLSLLMAIYKNEQELPANKVLLYEKCFEYMANTREKGKKLLRNSETNECYDWTVLGHFMQDATFMGLAQLGLPNNADIPKRDVESFLFDQYQNRFFSPVECKAGIEQFLQFCADRTEVFIPSIRSNDYYRFYHRSFYEYFYAKYIELHTHTVADTYQELCQFGPDSEVFDLLVTLYTRRNPNYLRELLSYAFSQVEPTIGHQGTASPYPLNTLVLLMQAVGDVDYIRRFITLFLTTKNRISQIHLDVEYTLIQAIFHKDPDYFMDQYRTNMQGLLACVQKELMEFFYRFPDQCDTLLSGIQKSELRLAPLNKQIGFSYIRIFSDLPFGNEQIEQCIINLSDGKYLYGKKRLNHNKATSVLKIVKKIRNLTVAQRARFYQALVAHI